jgi:hypothetical protein
MVVVASIAEASDISPAEDHSISRVFSDFRSNSSSTVPSEVMSALHDELFCSSVGQLLPAKASSRLWEEPYDTVQ